MTKGSSLDPSDKRLAVEVENHPLDYGDFERTIPKGQYGGDTVMLWDRGYWEPEGNMSPEEALKKGDFKFMLHGKRLHGSFVLVQMRHYRDGGKRTNWLLIKHHNDHSAEENGAAGEDDHNEIAALLKIGSRITDSYPPRPERKSPSLAPQSTIFVADHDRNHAADDRAEQRSCRRVFTRPRISRMEGNRRSTELSVVPKRRRRGRQMQ